jgi:hypothetical protein
MYQNILAATLVTYSLSGDDFSVDSFWSQKEQMRHAPDNTEFRG